MKTKMLKIVLFGALALAFIVGSTFAISKACDVRPQCDFDFAYITQ